MKGLRKYLTPFAPDQSGAVSVLFELGGISVIVDAGGCVGNICGFDEPRWFQQKSAIFSAGLRDMDAIMGRDELLVKKLVMAAEDVEAKFAAIIGTPVPAVIGTDYHALQRMAERKMKIPVLAVETTGMNYYDKGAEGAYLEIAKTFAKEQLPVEAGRIGVWGMNPLDMSDLEAGNKMVACLKEQGYTQVDCYGMGAGLDRMITASAAEKNLVVSPSGLLVANYLERTFGTPYEIANPLAEELIPDLDYQGKRVLVLHQQVTANTMRELLEAKGCARVDCGTWFLQQDALRRETDIHLREEDQCEELLNSGAYDIIFGDPVYEKMMKNFQGTFVGISQFAVSGKLVK